MVHLGPTGCRVVVQATAHVSFREAVAVWIRIALHSFGGPAGQIATMHRILVEEKKWLSEKRFLHALNYCMILPGPEAMQLATYSGWLLHGVRGGLVAGGLFVLPGFLAILALSLAYAAYQDASWLAALFFGLKAAVLAIIVEAVLRIGRRALRNGIMVLVAVAAFAAIFFWDIPFPWIILAAGLIGYFAGRRYPERFEVAEPRDPNPEDASGSGHNPPALVFTDRPRPTATGSIRTAVVWLLVWWVPLAIMILLLGTSHVFVQEGWFFSKTAIVTFGGAYAVLAYIAQRAVEDFGWLQPGEMLDGLGMAETTPGPLIQVVQFVGFMGAYRNPGTLDPLTAGILASIVVTWVTFVPCFLWIFLGAPYIEALRERRGITHALSGITAAVVGVILNLAAWFTLHVLWPTIEERHYAGGLRLLIPDWATLDLAALLIAAGALVALLRLRWGMLPVLGIATAVGIAYKLMVP